MAASAPHLWTSPTEPAGFVFAAPAPFHAPVWAMRRAGTAVRNDVDSDVIYYLNRTWLPVIRTES